MLLKHLWGGKDMAENYKRGERKKYQWAQKVGWREQAPKYSKREGLNGVTL